MRKVREHKISKKILKKRIYKMNSFSRPPYVCYVLTMLCYKNPAFFNSSSFRAILLFIAPIFSWVFYLSLRASNGDVLFRHQFNVSLFWGEFFEKQSQHNKAMIDNPDLCTTMMMYPRVPVFLWVPPSEGKGGATTTMLWNNYTPQLFEISVICEIIVGAYLYGWIFVGQMAEKKTRQTYTHIERERETR